MNFIDTHTHIYFDNYSDRIDDIIKTAMDGGINKIISVGVDLNTSEACIRLSEKYPIVYAACGYHPHEASKAPAHYIYELEQFFSHPKVVAVGEIGLDYHYNFSEPKDQQKIYHEQLELAGDIELPAIVHCRNSDEDVLNGIKKYSHGSGVIHCFASNLDFAHSIIKTGFYISFTGLITFVKDLEVVIQELPLEKIMIETDSPYLSPIPHRGKQNEPLWVRHVAEKIAELKNISLEEVAKSTTQTALTLFSKLISSN